MMNTMVIGEMTAMHMLDMAWGKGCFVVHIIQDAHERYDIIDNMIQSYAMV